MPRRKSFFAKLTDAQAALIVGLLGVFIGGGIITAIITGRYEVKKVQLQIDAEMTAEARHATRTVQVAAVPASTPIPTDTPTPACILTDTLTPRVIDTMDNTSDWQMYTGKGAAFQKIGPPPSRDDTIQISSVQGKVGNAIEISYDLKEETEWVQISKELEPCELYGAGRISFFYTGSGMSKTLELKLISVDGTTFRVLWYGATAMSNWTPIEVPYSQFDCHSPPEGCRRHADRLDLTKVEKLEFAISYQEGDTAGKGIVKIDHIEIRP